MIKIVHLFMGTILYFAVLPESFAETTTANAATDNLETRRAWDTASLLRACTDVSSYRICDPNYFVTPSDTKDQEKELQFSAITTALHKLESNHTLNCNNDQTSTEIQMAVVIVNSIKSDRFLTGSESKMNQAETIARTLHNTWGVGNIQCDGSGIVLFLSIQDRVVYISRGKGLKDVLSPTRIDHIIEKMKPFLREQQYSEATVNAIYSIIHYVDQPPSFSELYGQFFFVGSIIMLMAGKSFWDNKKKTQYVKVRTKLSQMDMDRALALRGKYECVSCPICLEDFHNDSSSGAEKNQNIADSDTSAKDKNENTIDEPSLPLGSDGKPITLLRCGHAFDTTCWNEWTSQPSYNIHQCPICKQDIGVSDVKSASSSLLLSHRFRSNHAQNNQNNAAASLTSTIRTQNENQPLITDSDSDSSSSRNSGPFRFRSSFTRSRQRDIENYNAERYFRLNRLRARYPAFIQQSCIDRWTRDDYNSAMVQDQDFIGRDPTIVAQNASNRSGSVNNHSSSGNFSSFGGGSSGGGGGGGW